MDLEMIEIRAVPVEEVCLFCKVCENYLEIKNFWSTLDEAVEIAQVHVCNVEGSK